jgi:orotidine-5'-phosphate decarboxylase
MGEKLKGKNGYSSLGAVMGATYPEEAEQMKEILPKAFKLVPGYGAGQGGQADAAVICVNPDGFGAVINNSRGTNYAYHPKFKTDFQCSSIFFASAASKAAKQGRDELNIAVLKKNRRLPW